ncbi:UNVERIFIED_CONTAM: hypothetical protein HDU68_007504 [Siphonaria sp. JEL0065]|nr:hypothetical protein HDU68_007504 [Siphonaria sp. JEL0065]
MATHCLFDMDGLLVDTESIHITVNTEILSRYGLTYTDDVRTKMMGIKERDSATVFVEHFKGKVPLTVDEYLQERKEKVIARMAHCKPLPGVIKLIRHLKEFGVPIAVATSSTRFMYNHKAKNNTLLFPNFDGHIVCSDDQQIKRGKPFPDLFLAGAQSLGIHATMETNNRNCLVFEDSELGALAGIRANMNVILVPDKTSVIDPAVIKQCAKVLQSLEAFDPTEFGLPPFPL